MCKFSEGILTVEDIILSHVEKNVEGRELFISMSINFEMKAHIILLFFKAT